jgi:two-component system, cell cycle response regulator
VVPVSPPDGRVPGQDAELRLRRPDGSEYVVELSSLDLTYDGKPAQVTIAHDITDRLRHQEETERLVRELADTNAKLLALSNTDELTSLWNYRRLLELIEDEMRRSRRTRQPASLVMMDIDHFKRFNDASGHEAGNTVLRGVALLLRKNLREIDVLARYGGEELCALLPATRAPEAAVVAERLRQAVASEPFAGAEHQPGGHLSISLGVAELALGDGVPADLIRRADQALYRAKRNGRNRVEVATTPR